MPRGTALPARPAFSQRPRRNALTLALAFGFSAGAFAQSNERQLGETVVSASGFEQQIKEAPASISVITREDLETKRITNIADALADVEGIDTGGSAGKTGGLNIRIRGLGDEYTLVLIDGRRQNSTGNIYPNGFGEARNSFLPPVSAIERIEVIRGPMSTLYGSDAMGGVVNIITRKVGKEWTGSLTVEGTQVEDSDFGGSYSAEVFASGPIKQDLLGLQVRARNWHREQSSIAYDLDDGTSGDELTQGRNPTKGRIENYGARLTLTPNKDHDLWLDIDTTKQSYDNSKQQLGTLGAAGGYGPTQQYNRDKFLLAHNWRTGSGLLESSLSYNETETVGRLIPARLLGRSGDRGLTTKDFIFDTKYVTGIGNHILSIGAQYWNAEMEDGILPKATEFTQVGIFAEDEWRLAESLALTLGVRHDHHDEFGGYTTPRAYMVWNTTENWTVKGGISRGYKAPRLEYLTNGIYTVSGHRQPGSRTGNQHQHRDRRHLRQPAGLHRQRHDLPQQVQGLHQHQRRPGTDDLQRQNQRRRQRSLGRGLRGLPCRRRQPVGCVGGRQQRHWRQLHPAPAGERGQGHHPGRRAVLPLADQPGLEPVGQLHLHRQRTDQRRQQGRPGE
ncbi:TonB-dependent receptor-like protein [Azoarcus indigens]|uniref:TonB-dependent receptor-like protein n=1 Tax=Azoarcus indigens TaxID=29545 RepID=A0A4R6DVM4_9RHOO|nr:TonB-dependent receptor-like protein [Azoarcus indigens]